MNLKEKQAAWLKQRKDEEKAAFKRGRQRMVNHARINKRPPMPEEPEFIQRYCPGCNDLLAIHGKLKNLIGKEFECSACSTHFIVLDPFPKKPGILSRMMDGFAKAYEEEQIQKEKNSKAWIGIVGFAIGAYIGLTRKKDK